MFDLHPEKNVETMLTIRILRDDEFGALRSDFNDQMCHKPVDIECNSIVLLLLLLYKGGDIITTDLSLACRKSCKSKTLHMISTYLRRTYIRELYSKDERINYCASIV